MIERVENTLQLAVLLLCVGAALCRAVGRRSRTWTLLVFFFGSWWMGDLYWLICLIFFGATPRVSVVSDLSWYASYLFLYLLLQHAAPREAGGKKRLLPWLGPVFAAAMAVFFLQWGEFVGNLVCAVLMAQLLFAALQRLADGERNGGRRMLCLLTLLFCLFEYGLWTSSCFWAGDTFANPYYWCDLLLTALFPFFLPATGKAAAA